jgi:DNA-binding LacI/PurR family transcriptional regulator
VHVSTVSRVLNGDPAQSIRPEIYDRILSTARTQGYRPNALARALKRRRTGALAFVIPLLRNPIWVRFQRGALQRASERGYVVMIMEEPALRGSGIAVPAEMSVVSFDEDECLAFLDVPVTSVAMPLAELGSAAVDALIARIERKPASDVMVREPMRLLPRHSVSHPPRPTG